MAQGSHPDGPWRRDTLKRRVVGIIRDLGTGGVVGEHLEHKDWLRDRIRAAPDLTLSALVAELAAASGDLSDTNWS